jgi:hypothetical protein
MHNPLLQATTFRQYKSVVLYPGAGNESAPRWLVLHDGAEVAQVEDTTIPAMLIGTKQAHRRHTGRERERERERERAITIVCRYNL